MLNGVSPLATHLNSLWIRQRCVSEGIVCPWLQRYGTNPVESPQDGKDDKSSSHLFRSRETAKVRKELRNDRGYKMAAHTQSFVCKALRCTYMYSINDVSKLFDTTDCEYCIFHFRQLLPTHTDSRFDIVLHTRPNPSQYGVWRVRLVLTYVWPSHV